jgi:hypothetical protein
MQTIPVIHHPVAHAEEALYLVELNKELRNELRETQLQEKQVAIELSEVTEENERMENQLRYLRGLQQNLHAKAGYHDAITTSSNNVLTLHVGHTLKTQQYVCACFAIFCSIIPCLFAWVLVDGFNMSSDTPVICLSVSSSVFGIKAFCSYVRNENIHNKSLSSANIKLQQSKRDLEEFVHNCDFVSELIDNA